MASSPIPRPGTAAGPCVGECLHTDCIATRSEAADLCTICKTPIGYDRHRYGRLNDAQHAVCLEDQVAAKLQAGATLVGIAERRP